jgi:LysR family transcriptional activator of nhaA
LRFVVGVDDVVPKEVVQRLLDPALHLAQSVRLTCKEGTLDRLVADLAVHESDLVLSDAPFTPALNFRVYSHPLGTCEVTWMAASDAARKLRAGFPKSLNGAPMLLPTLDTAIRRALDQWLDRHDLRPTLFAEFEDYGLLLEFARAGRGFAPVPVILEQQFRRQYGLARVGPADSVRAEFYALSVERKLKHPAIAAVVEHGRRMFARHGSLSAVP